MTTIFTEPVAPRLGGHILVDALVANGVETAFCVPGESYLPVLDGLYEHREKIALYVCRQEGGAAFMADAYGKLTGRPGVCLVTRGPGACNASIGVHNAMQDSSPMILLVGQVGADCADREAFQEIDIRRVFGPIAKWAAQIDSADRIGEYISRAIYTAQSGRPGPVVLGLPENVLFGHAAPKVINPAMAVQASPSGEDISRLKAILESANRPMVILGGSGWTAKACSDIQAFIESNHLPVTCAFRFQDLFDNRHPNYAGDVGLGINPMLAKRIKEADVLLVIGARLGEATTSGYTLLDIPVPKQRLIHVHAGNDELGKVYQAELPINSGMPQIAKALAGLKVRSEGWAHTCAEANRQYLTHATAPTISGSLQMNEVVRYVQERLPEDAIVANGAGNYAIWMNRYFKYRRFNTQLAPTSGSMGYGVPASIAAKIVHRERVVVSWNGDGCFMMNGQELATAVRYGLNIVFVIVNNGMFGTIRMHQEMHYPGRVHGTGLENPDFCALAEAYGAHGERVTRSEDFPAAFERALVAGRPAVIELVVDPEAITPTQTISSLRAAVR